MNRLSSRHKIRSLLLVTAGGFGFYGAMDYVKNKESFYQRLIPIIHVLEPETAHKLAVFAGKYRLYPKSSFSDPDSLKVKLFGKEFPNPIGIAAGFDKHGEAILGLQDLGFGFVEIGSVTLFPQAGNEKPRVFRLKKDEAVINRYGFNSDGSQVVFQRLESLKSNHKLDSILGINLGKNKDSQNAIHDYVEGIEKFGPIADYLVINISSPNTPGLRDMQIKSNLIALLSEVVKARNNLPFKNKPSLLLKLAPDLTKEEQIDIADVVKLEKCKVDGLIICNTTIDRPDYLKSEEKSEIGGLSGKPLKDISTQMISNMFILTGGMPIIGVGGISSGQDAYEKIKAGARIVQIYTALVYEGPIIVDKIKRELSALLEKDGYKCVDEAVGKEVL
ncbi:dihydroorotate dehydrogenase (quinone), mitochondrial [Onthophagus taurus]|uniref:dihydroorotate dehydrogenase (quinone), mitochondrial n=1 Tax=Onthophagus taurus TaxID=166361 RepID=UPI0039BDD2E1